MNRKTFWIMIIVGLIILLLFVAVGNVLIVGERLAAVHVYLSYAFYALAVVLLYILILHPLKVIFLSPTFTIEDGVDEKVNAKAYKAAAKSLLKTPKLTDEERTLLIDNLDEDSLPDALKTVFNGSVRKTVDDIILAHSKTVLVTTAISQNGNLDMMSVIFTNIRMVKSIVKACGFRPSIANIAKLGINVTITAMIAENLEGVKFHEMMPSKFGETITDLPMLKTATNSIFQGVSNGMLTCRIGIVTRRYLFQDNRMMSQTALRLAAYKETFRLMPIVITDGLATFPKAIVSFALRPFKKPNPFAKGEAT